jgi:tetratricopeptide (TPR) repeat protein
MAQLDALLDDLIKSQVETLVQDDSYYQMLATPLKPASAIKQAHRTQLVEFFKLKDLRSQLENAPTILMELLPDFVSRQDFEVIKAELDNSGEHFVRFVESMAEESDRPILFQEMFGLTDDTLLHIYELSVDVVKKGNYKDANTLFVFLTTLAPHVSSYWIAQGACLQVLSRHEEAVAVFNAAKFLNPADPAPCAYSVESYIELKDAEKAKQELGVLKDVVKALEGEDKKIWEQKLKDYSL